MKTFKQTSGRARRVGVVSACDIGSMNHAEVLKLRAQRYWAPTFALEINPLNYRRIR